MLSLVPSALQRNTVSTPKRMTNRSQEWALSHILSQDMKALPQRAVPDQGMDWTVTIGFPDLFLIVEGCYESLRKRMHSKAFPACKDDSIPLLCGIGNIKDTDSSERLCSGGSAGLDADWARCCGTCDQARRDLLFRLYPVFLLELASVCVHNNIKLLHLRRT